LLLWNFIPNTNPIKLYNAINTSQTWDERKKFRSLETFYKFY